MEAMESTSLIILMLGINMSLTLGLFFYLKGKIDKQNKFNQQLANAINNHFYHINLIKQNYQHKESKVEMESKDGKMKQLQGETDLFYIDESDIPK